MIKIIPFVFGDSKGIYLVHKVPYPEGREVILASRHEIGGILTEAKRRDSDAWCLATWCLATAAHIVRKDIPKVDNSFNGKFFPECQKNSIPASLLSLVGMLIKGPTTKIDPSNNEACVSVSQLIVFNSVARPHHWPEATGSTHHIRSRECPLPIYTVPKIHRATRDRALIDAFYSPGLSISYDRFLMVSTEITNSIIDRFSYMRITENHMILFSFDLQDEILYDVFTSSPCFIGIGSSSAFPNCGSNRVTSLLLKGFIQITVNR